MVRATSRDVTPQPAPVAEPVPWSYGWSLANINLETLLDVTGVGRLYIGHAPGGALREIASVHFNPTAVAKTVVRWQAFTVSEIDSKNPVIMATGEVEIGPVYGVRVLWRPRQYVATTGYMQPIYLDMQVVDGLRTNLGTMTMSILMGGAQ